jgi:alkaline phosphatase
MLLNVEDENDLTFIWNKFIDFSLTTEQKSSVLQSLSTKETKQTQLAINNIINKESYTGWTTLNHTADDIQVFSYGNGSDAFRGHQDNTDIADKIFNLLNQ